MTKQEKLLHYWKLAQILKSDEAKAAFFDDNEEAFNLDSPNGEDLENCKYSFFEEKGFSGDQIDDFESNDWSSFPKDFKVYAFEYCIIDGITYENIKDSMSVDEITALIPLETLNEKIESEGLMLSEAEDEIMLILENRIKENNGSALEDDLYDATHQLLSDLRDWLDDNHPDNLEAA